MKKIPYKTDQNNPAVKEYVQAVKKGMNNKKPEHCGKKIKQKLCLLEYKEGFMKGERKRIGKYLGQCLECKEILIYET